MIKFSGIKAKTVIYTIIPVIVSFIIISTILFFSLFNAYQNTAKAEFNNIVKKHTKIFENKISGVIDYLSFVSSVLEFQIAENETDRESLQKLLSIIFHNNSDIDGSSIYFEPDMYDGKDAEYRGTLFGTGLSGRICFYYSRIGEDVSYSAEALENEEEFSLPLYLKVKNSNMPIYTDPFDVTIDDEKIFMFVIAYPIHGKNGEFIGAITGDIHLKEIYQTLQAEKIYKTGAVFITNDNGRIIFSSKYEDIGKTREEAGLVSAVPSAPQTQYTSSTWLEEIHNKSVHPVTEDSQIIKIRSALNNKNTFIARETIFFPQLNSRYYFSVVVPLDEVNAEGNRLLVIVLVISMFILFGISSILYFIAGKITKPIIEFSNVANKIAQGNYNIRIENDYRDEFLQLKETLNLMTSRIEENINESEKSLRILKNILNGINALIYVIVPETCELLFINDALRNMFNLKEEEGIGQSCYKLFRNSDTRCSFCPCRELEKNPDSKVIWEEHHPDLGKDIRHINCLIDWPGKVKVLLQYAFDITEVKKITEEKLLAQQEKERAETTSRMKSVFLASMSHEIRTPMHGIIGFSELALDDNIPLKTKNYLSKIKTSAESLLLIINDILDVSKVEAGKMELENIPFNINEVFKLCRMISSPKAQEKGLTLFCYAEPSVGRMIVGDPTRLRQVLLNLISNAIKFTNNGMVKMLSAITAKTDDTITMHFEVKDSGIGMTEDQLNRIFQPFMQADGSTTRKYGGTGLGLTIAKNLIDLMGGSLTAESTFGLGSRFSFELTFKTINKTESNQAIMPAVYFDEKPIFKGEVLICEDNALNQMVISDHLSKVGLKSVIAVNGRIALELIKKRIENKEKLFDLIFMDIHMPEMDGLETSSAIIGMELKIPIIALTANIMANDKDTYLEAGMLDCLPKPFVTQELWSCLLNYLKPVSKKALKKATDHLQDEQIEEEEKQMQLIRVFVNSNQTTIKDIKDALGAEDTKTAHRLAHTLKGVAKLVGQKKLSQAAQAAEDTILSGNTEQLSGQMKVLESEMEASLAELIPLCNHNKEKTGTSDADGFVDKESALKLLEKLDLLLEEDNFDSLNLVNDLRMIPGTVQLIIYIENMKFKQAREALTSVRREILNIT